jgi:hypothetical protein
MGKALHFGGACSLDFGILALALPVARLGFGVAPPDHCTSATTLYYFAMGTEFMPQGSVLPPIARALRKLQSGCPDGHGGHFVIKPNIFSIDDHQGSDLWVYIFGSNVTEEKINPEIQCNSSVNENYGRRGKNDKGFQ